MEFLARLRRLRKKMAAGGVDSLLVTHLPDVMYLCGFTGSNAAVVITARRAALYTDGRYTAQAKEEARGVRVVIAKKSAQLEAIAFLLALGVAPIAFDPETTTVSTLNALRASLPKERRAKTLVPLKAPLVADLRMVKDADEVERMQAAAALGDQLFNAILPAIQPGVPEVEIAAELEHAARRGGAEGMSFSTIVASGVRSSFPHGTASVAKLPGQGFVTLDFGVILRGYCSDMTRTVHMGKASVEERSAYEAVLEAQEHGVNAVAAGVTCGEVDYACRSVLAKHKLAKFFTHSTGHGVGLEIHEQPRVAKEQSKVLESGMVITIEPGVYMPGRFGIRIEDTVVVTKNGCGILTKATKAWIEL
jgi:Xaa-Pro aminopeptidase